MCGDSIDVDGVAEVISREFMMMIYENFDGFVRHFVFKIYFWIVLYCAK